MGCISSSGKSYQQKKALHRKSSSVGGGLEKYILKFPTIRKSFHILMDNYKLHSQKEKQLTLPEFQLAIKDLQIEENMLIQYPPEQVFKSHSKSKTFLTPQQFTAAICINWLFNYPKQELFDYCKVPVNDPKEHVSEELAAFQQLGKGFILVQKAFKTIDNNDDGYISGDEFITALRCGAIAKNRIAECDLNFDGQLCIEEFLYGFCIWCDIEMED